MAERGIWGIHKHVPESFRLAVAVILLVLLGFLLGGILRSVPGPIPAKGSCDAVALFSPGSEGDYMSFISNSRKSVEIEMYEFSYSPLMERLEQAAARGVRVRIILDKTVDANYAAARELASKGVLVRFAPSGFERLHAKFVVSDLGQAIVGSTNWSFHAMFLNREASLLIGNCAVVADLSQVFESDWEDGDPYVT